MMTNEDFILENADNHAEQIVINFESGLDNTNVMDLLIEAICNHVNTLEKKPSRVLVFSQQMPNDCKSSFIIRPFYARIIRDVFDPITMKTYNTASVIIRCFD